MQAAPSQKTARRSKTLKHQGDGVEKEFAGYIDDGKQKIDERMSHRVTPSSSSILPNSSPPHHMPPDIGEQHSRLQAGGIDEPTTAGILAHRLVANAAHYHALVPLIDATRARLGAKPREGSGDTGFATEANLAAMAERRIRAYLPPGRARHGETDGIGRRTLKNKPLMAAMADRLKRAGRRSRYRLRKQTVEPVFGQIKQARGFRRFLLRGRNKVRGEWAMIWTAHNLLKLADAASA